MDVIGSEPSYRLSFSTGGLFISDSVKLAELYLELRAWPAVRKAASDQGLTQFSASSSATRTVRELVTRLSTLDDDELQLLCDGGSSEQAALLWLALCRTYPLIREFATEVLAERLASFRTALGHEHFDAFIANKAQWNDAIADLSETTLKKLRQILFRYMREAGLLLENGTIAPYLLPGTVRVILEQKDAAELSYFPGVRGAA